MSHEPTIRLIAFFGTFFIMIFWESMSPQVKLKYSKYIRWTNNITLVTLNSILIKVVFAYSGMQMAMIAKENGWGFFNLLELPEIFGIVSSIIFLDFAIYFQHLIFHRFSILWRLHRMHHADLDYDVTTGLRFHPLEILLSMGIKLVIIIVLGVPAVAVILFEIILNSMAMFNHGNVRLNKKLDLLLRKVVVTPDMHRIHHSVIDKETHSNFGFNLSIWDRIFNTYTHQGQQSPEKIVIGLPYFREIEYLMLHKMLQIPFIKAVKKEDSHES